MDQVEAPRDVRFWRHSVGTRSLTERDRTTLREPYAPSRGEGERAGDQG